MIIKNKQKNKAFVMLFAVTISAIVLAIALGVANIAQKEIKFGTSAKDTNDAFLAADVGIECALFNDKAPSLSFDVSTPTLVVNCLGNNISVDSDGGFGFYFHIVGLGSSGKGCAHVFVDKSSGTTINSKGYNIDDTGDAICSSSNKTNLIERELEISY